MKSIKLTLIAIIGFISIATAQQKTVNKVVINTPTVQCEMCKNRLESYLSREPGVSVVKVYYKKKDYNSYLFNR